MEVLNAFLKEKRLVEIKLVVNLINNSIILDSHHSKRNMNLIPRRKGPSKELISKHVDKVIEGGECDLTILNIYLLYSFEILK